MLYLGAQARDVVWGEVVRVVALVMLCENVRFFNEALTDSVH